MEAFNAIAARAARTSSYGNTRGFNTLCAIFAVLFFFGFVGMAISTRMAADSSAFVQFYGIRFAQIVELVSQIAY